MKPQHLIGSISNIAFPILGVFGMAAPMPWGLLFLIAMTFLGLASGLAHMFPLEKNFWLLDEIGMYAVASVIACQWGGIPWYGAILVAVGMGIIAKEVDSFFVIPLFTAYILGAMMHAGSVWAWIAAGIFGLAFYLRQRDKDHAEGFWSAPWHILMAVACFIAFISFYVPSAGTP